jgi:pimeloyl-ACP methyl ester carboxylesterase
MKEGTVQLTDGRMFYRLAGKGEPLILLHSLGLSSEMWLTTMPILAEQFTVYAPDLMGHGDSDKPERYYEIADHAARIVEFMNALGVDKACLCGSSLGSAIAIDLSVSDPGRVKQLVLAACPITKSRWDGLEMIFFMASRYDANGMSKSLTMQDIDYLFVKPTSETLEFVNRLRAKAGKWCKIDQGALALWDTMPLLPKIEARTLVLYGVDDRLGTVSGGLRILTESIKSVQSFVLENASHFPSIDNPVGFAQAVLKFLKPE